MEAVPKATEIERLLAESEWIRGLARGLVGDSHRAEDLAQEAHLAALRAPVEGSGSMRPWLASVTRNAARMLFRSEGARSARETELARDRSQQAEPSPEDLLGQLETQEQLSRLVRELPAELSDVILLHFFEGLGLQEIAQLRDIPAGTVRWRKKRGLECLKERLDTTHGGDRQAWLSALAPLVAPRWRAGAKAVTGVAATSGLLAPWIAMTLTWKLISLALFAVLLSIPFVNGEDADVLDPGVTPVVQVPEKTPLETRSPSKESGPAELASLADPERATPVAPEAAEPDSTAPPITRIRLRVVDVRGVPVANAYVRPSPSLELEASHRELIEGFSDLELVALAASMSRKTGPDGLASWESDLLREDGIVDFRVEGPHFGIGNLEAALEVGSDVDLGDVTLSEAGAVKGRVVDSNGRGLNSIRVCAQSVDRNGAGEEQQAALSMGELLGLSGTRSGYLGRFELLGLAPGEYRLCMQTGRKGPLPVSEPFWVVAGVRTENILIREFATAQARKPEALLILDADGEPLLSALVHVETKNMSTSGVVDGNGRWGTAGNLVRFAGGRLEVSDKNFRHSIRVIDPLPEDTSSLVVQLERAPYVQRELVVRSRAGEAIESVGITVSVDGVDGGMRTVAGTAEISLPDPAHGPISISFHSKGYLPLTLKDVNTDGLPNPWLVELLASPGIQGQVIAKGAPVKKAKVTLFPRVKAGFVKKKGNAISAKGFVKLDQVTTDSQGAFHVEHSNDGAYVLVASARGYADAMVELPNYEAAQGATQITFTMDEGGEVKGTVFDSQGQPVPRAHLVLNHGFHKIQRKRAGRDGSFRFRRIPDGQWMLRVVENFDGGFFGTTSKVAEDWRFPSNCTVVTGQTTQFDLHLPDPEGTSVAGVWNAQGEQAKGWTATVSSLNGGMFGGDPFQGRWSSEQLLSPGQNFEFPVQPGREYHLRLTHASVPGMLSREVSANDLPAQVAPPSEFTTFRAHPRASITSAAKTEALIIEWRQDGWTYRARLSPNQDGTFGPTLVPAGSVSLLWNVPGSDETVDMQIEAEANEVLDVEL